MYPHIGSCCPNYFFRLLLRWLGLVWRRELGDRADPHAPIFHHYGTAFIHGHEANPIPLRMVCATRQRGGGGSSSTSMLSPISGASSQTISVEFMRREWVSCFLFNNTITHRSNLSLTLISIHRSMVPLQLNCRAVGRSENPGVPVLFGGHNLPPLVEGRSNYLFLYLCLFLFICTLSVNNIRLHLTSISMYLNDFTFMV